MLTALPTELLLRIVEFVHPSSHLDLACTCKLLSQCCSDILRHHRRCASTYCVVTDIQPDTIPAVLRLALKDPVVAWHVRSATIWGHRHHWSQWRDIYPHTRFRLVDQSPLRTWSYMIGEVDDWVDLLNPFIPASERSKGYIARDLRNGNDGIIKVIFLILCPRLNVLSIVPSKHNPLYNPVTATHSTLQYLIDGRFCMEEAHVGPWTLSLSSLTHVSLGSSLSGEDHQAQPDVSVEIFAHIIQLPNLKSLVLHNWHINDTEDMELFFASMRQPSSVRHLYFDRMTGHHGTRLPKEMFLHLKYLETLVFRGGHRFVLGASLEVLQESCSQSLQHLISYDSAEMYGSDYHLYSIGHLGAHGEPQFEQMRNLTIDMCDIVDDFLKPSEKDDSNLSDKVSGTLCGSIPTAVEILIFQCSLGIIEEHVDVIDAALAKLIKSDEYPNLRALFLEEAELRSPPGLLSDNPPTPRSKLLFQCTIRCGFKYGVSVSTKLTPCNLSNEMGLPTIPNVEFEQQDLVSRLGEDGVRFSAALGRWIPRACGDCGRCDDCYTLYSPDLWRQWNEIKNGLVDLESESDSDLHRSDSKEQRRLK